jgi:hemoglobin
MSTTTLYERIGGKPAINTLVDNFYAKMQEDYRLNRFFNSKEIPEQKEALAIVLTAYFGGTSHTEEELTALVDDFFLTAFARDKRKSFVGGSDFGFFGYIIAQDHPSTQYLCDSHSHLLKFMPDDSHYDVVMEHLAASLQSLSLENGLANEVLRLAEQARNPVLGK